MKHSGGKVIVAVLSMLLAAGLVTCSKAKTASDGDTVRVHYTGTLEDGTTFDSSAGRDPLQFTLGRGQLIPGFEKAVIGMKVDDSIRIDIPAAEAYGPYRKELIQTVDRDKLPPNQKLELGQILTAQQPNGQNVRAKITELNESTVTLDANHPLAGKNLTFEIQLQEILPNP
jgi:peptidylprolyl isomerase